MLKLDETKIKKYAEAQATVKSIAAVCNVSEDTLQRRYLPLINRWKQIGKANLMLAMWEKGIKKKDPQILKHLAKHFLGQHDQIQLTNSCEPEVRKLLMAWGAQADADMMLSTKQD